MSLDHLSYDELLTNTLTGSEIEGPIFIEEKNVLLIKSTMPDKNNDLLTTAQAMHFLEDKIVIVQFMLFEKDMPIYLEDFKKFLKAVKF